MAFRNHCATTARAALIALALAACDARQTTASGGRAALERNLAHVRVVEIHVEDEGAAEDLRRLAALERARSGRDVRVVVRARGDRGAARIVVGTARGGVAAMLAARVGIALAPGADGGFRVADLEHAGPDDAARATFEDPERPGLPVTLWLGNDLARLVPQIEDAIPRADPSFATWRGGDPVMAGALWPDGEVVSRTVERFAFARNALRGPAAVVLETERVRVEVPVALDPAVAARTAALIDDALARASSWTGAEWPRVAVRILDSVEDHRLGGESASLGRWNRARPAADVLVVGGIGDGGAAAARAGLRGARGAAVVPGVEEGARGAAAGGGGGGALDRWLARLAIAGAVPRVARLVDPAADLSVSPHVLAPARAVLFEHLRDSRGDAFVRGIWTGTRALAVDDELERGFADALAERTEPFRAEVARLGVQRRAEILGAAAAAGVVLAESRPDPRGGYGSSGSLAVIETLRRQGAGSVAIEAAFVGCELDLGWRTPRALNPRAGDVALFATAIAARNAHLRTSLSAHVLASDSGSYAGAWPRNDEPEWTAWFEHQARVVEHAALLSNLCRADWLVIGSGLRAISGSQPDGRRWREEERAWKVDGWRRVIGAARGAFPGALTYGASDVLEANAIEFWGDLDAVGCDLDPRAEPESPQPREELELRMARTLLALGELARRVERPVVLTHVSLAPELHRGPAASADWTAVQLGLLDGAIRALTDPDAGGDPDARLDVVAAWLARVGTDPADRGAGPSDPILNGADDGVLAPFFAAAPGWVRAGAARDGTGASEQDR